MDSKESPMPPALQLSDAGVRWRREGTALLVERRANVLALFFPLLTFGTALAIATIAFRDGDPVVGGVMAFGALLAGVVVWIRTVQRADLVIDANGVLWHHTRPRAFHGRWARDRIDGLRINVHPKGRWLEPRQAHVELRVDGSWQILVFGGRVKRAERLAEALALTTGLSPDRTGRP